MEILFEYRGSRRKLEIAEKESVTRVVGDELRRVGKPRAQVFTASDDLPSSGGGGQKPDIYLLQRWSDQWDCYVDVGHYNEVTDSDKLAVIAKPKPSSLFSLLCCCRADSSYQGGKVGGSSKIKIPKSEEIQSLEYRFRAESEAGSILDEKNAVLEEHANKANDLKDGEQYIRAGSGRAAWKLVENTAEDSTPDPMQNEGESNEELEQRQGVVEIQEEPEVVDEEEGERKVEGEELCEGSEGGEESEEVLGGVNNIEDEVAPSQENGNEDTSTPNANLAEEEVGAGENAEGVTTENKHEEVQAEDGLSPIHVPQSHDRNSEPQDNVSPISGADDGRPECDDSTVQVETISNQKEVNADSDEPIND